MIIRIVQMTFREEAVEEFRNLFEERRGLIRNTEGCRYLALWQDIHCNEVFFTCSHWESEAHLNAYRSSALFEDTWKHTKALFADRPQAWSIAEQVVAE